MNRDGNSYTFIFSAVMVIIIAGALAFTATSLKDKQDINIKNEKMQNILSTIGVKVDRDHAKEYFDKYIKQQLALKSDSTIDTGIIAFDVDLAKELKKPLAQQRFPLYIANVEGDKYYIIPLRGVGLWDAIWGYISLKVDLNTVKGVVFDHKGETVGLGGEITQPWFQSEFVGETISQNDSFFGIAVTKGNNDPKGMNKNDHKVDAISGATITSNGVTDMIKERLLHYIEYFKSIKNKEL